MSFPVALNAGSFGDLIFPGVNPRAPVTYPIINARNDTNTRNTVNLFIDSTDDVFQFAASVIDACVGTTVYALQCTEGPVAGSICGPTAASATLTYGETNYHLYSFVETSTMGYDVKAEAEETCKLEGTTAASCTRTVSASAAGITSETTTTTTVFGSKYHRFDVEITSGAEKTFNRIICKTGAASGLNSKSMSLWALVGVIGVASVLSM